MILTAIINRAVPGSGKTTISRILQTGLKPHGLDVAVHSTDDFFVDSEGAYRFDPCKLQENHQKNLDKFRLSLTRRLPVVICDNSNLAPWQAAPYCQAAREHGYGILFLDYIPREPENHCSPKGIPVGLIADLIREYNDYSPLLYREKVIDPVLHKDWRWNPERCQKEATAETPSHFDLDFLIRVQPADFNTFKSTVVDIIHRLIYKGEQT